MTVDEYWVAVREFLKLRRTGPRVGNYEICRDQAGAVQQVRVPDDVPFEERREMLEMKAKQLGIELPPGNRSH